MVFARTALFLTIALAGAATRNPPPEYAGSAQCATCHPKQSKLHTQSGMAQALEPVAASGILRSNSDLTYRFKNYTFRIERRGNASVYTVSDGKETITAAVKWAFGKGAAGQTYILEHEGKLYESRVSFYNALKGLDLTMGASDNPATPLQALGRPMDAADVRSCFGCHSTAGLRGDKFDFVTMVPGVQCENCHGPALAHALARKGGELKTGAMKKLSTLSTEQMNELCGACHRTWEHVATNGPFGVANVRFQPYRITGSPCYDTEDPRISCSACHDPHEAPRTDARYYDAKCGACHGTAAQAKAKPCPVRRNDCVTCHMPKVEIPQSHFSFADHRIRVVRKNEPFPN